MPTVSVLRSELEQLFGRRMEVKELFELSFQFGLELDEVCEETDPVYKIEVPANRYDLLSPVGICTALRLFCRRSSRRPKIRLGRGKTRLLIDEEVREVRPCVVAAVIKNVDLTGRGFQQLIDLQEKIHHNLGRQRTLVSIGLHDFDKIAADCIRYTVRCPIDITFTPLAGTAELTGNELVRFYHETAHLKPYAALIEKFSKWPLILDGAGDVLSQPPVINGQKSRVSEETRNLLIEVTGTDSNRCQLALNAITYQMPCSSPFLDVFPLTQWCSDSRPVEATIRDLAGAIPSQQRPPAPQLLDILSRMGYLDVQYSQKSGKINLQVPYYRSDVMHLCDIQEDVCIGFGYQNISTSDLTGLCFTEGKQLAIEMLVDQCRQELARCGYCEALTFVLCPKDEVRGQSGKAVTVANPRSWQCSSLRQVLWGGLLKTLACNKHLPLPILLFEISDVVNTARQRKHAAWLFAGKRCGLEDVMGTMDRLFAMMRVDVELVELDSGDDNYLAGRVANIVGKNGHVYGIIGVLNPDVVNESFRLQLPCSVCEIDLEAILEDRRNIS